MLKTEEVIMKNIRNVVQNVVEIVNILNLIG